jgi:very-short-patch-repair endonuclease
VPVPSLRASIARELRRNMNKTERRLWNRLRMRQLEGWKFRSQHPIGPYFVDFYYPAARLVVEIDGPTHGEDAQLPYDERRTSWLSQQGYDVLRFWTSDVDESLDDVMAAIYLHLSGSLDGPIRRFAPPSPPSGEVSGSLQLPSPPSPRAGK